MHECCGECDGQQEDSDQQAVELSIVILVDGEEKCSSKVGRQIKGAKSTHGDVGHINSCPSSRPTTAPSSVHLSQSKSTTSVPCNKRTACTKHKCGAGCPHHHNNSYHHECPYENNNVGHCANCCQQQQPRIIPTSQSHCPCAGLRNDPCGTCGAPLQQVKSQTAACQTICHGECQTDPQVQAVASVQRTHTQTCTTPSLQSSSCQTAGEAPKAHQQRPCTPRTQPKCQKKAKSAICQTHAQRQPHMARPQTGGHTMAVQVESQVQTICPSSGPVSQSVQACPSVSQQSMPVCQQGPIVQQAPVGQAAPVSSCMQISRTTVTITPEPCVCAPAPAHPPVCKKKRSADKEHHPPREHPPPSEEPMALEGPPRAKPKEDKVRKVRRTSREEPAREPAEARKARRSSVPPEQLNFSHFPTVQLSFVDYFLKSEGGVSYVIALAETKLEYEKKCKSILATMSHSKRTQAEEFFNSIIEAIQVKIPESNNTEIKHYHLGKYLQPIVAALRLQASEELHVVNKYHHYILNVVNFMEERLRERQVINPDALVDIETHLLAGILSRFYPVFLRIKENAISMAEQKSSPYAVPPETFVKQLRKLILAIYVEIVCIDVTFTNTLTGLTYLPSNDVQEKYRHQLSIRKKHARHAVTWAARCITTVLLYNFVA